MAGFDWLFAPEPEACPAPIKLPDRYRDLTRDADLLPPIPPPEPKPEQPPPTTAEQIALALATVAAITTRLRDEEDCEQGCERCIPLHAGAGGIPPPPCMPYPNQRNRHVGYENQHHVVNWLFHDPAARIIMEWQFNGIWFDGLDLTRGTLLAGRAIRRAEYDPAGTSRCYLIDTKYGYEVYVRYDAWADEWVRSLDFFWVPWKDEMTRQIDAFKSSYPNVCSYGFSAIVRFNR